MLAIALAKVESSELPEIDTTSIQIDFADLHDPAIVGLSES